MTKPKWRQDTETFKYHNENPKNSKSAGDCVVRAIATATGRAWDDVYEDLCKLGAKMKMMPNDDKVYRKYLENIGLTKSPQPRKSDNTKYTVEEFAKFSRYNDSYIISVANHLTVVKHNKIYDTWNCGHKCVGNYWTIHD